MKNPTQLHEILRIKKEELHAATAALQEATGKQGVVEELERDIEQKISDSFSAMSLPSTAKAEEVLEGLFEKIKTHEQQLYTAVGIDSTHFDFEKIAEAARAMAPKEKGFFLKKEYAEKILRERPPEKALEYLGYQRVEDMLGKEDVVEVFSALRFIESNEWMHETFRVAYNEFTPDDFEYREIDLRVLGNQWAEIAQKFVAKKHHNVSHLKEFGVIFLNPIAQTEEGKFLRDFALLLHYFHEVILYSKLFERSAKTPRFNEEFVSFLRGDVPEPTEASSDQWLIVQRYLWKEDPQDPRLFLPRVNPESLHWRKAEQDLARFGQERAEIDIEFWNGLDSVAAYFESEKGGMRLLSFDMEDNAMSLVAAHNEGTLFTYHQHEATWNELFRRFVGEERMEELIIESFSTGILRISDNNQ